MGVEAEGLFLILKKIKYSEADLIVHALSQSGEKMSFLARGALRSKKRFGGGVLEPTHYVRLTYTEAYQTELHTLKEATLLSGFEGIRTDYDKLSFALSSLTLISQVSLEGDSGSSGLYNLLGHMLRRLESDFEISDLVLLKTLFYIKFLKQQGILEVEDWMKPFMSVNLSDVDALTNLQIAKSDAQKRIQFLEKNVQHYAKSAAI